MGDRAERLVNLTIALLEARAPMTLADLRRRTGFYTQGDPEAGRRMFERDKDALRSLGIPLQTVTAPGDTGDVGYVLHRDEYELGPIDLTVDEMSALAVALSAVADRSAASGFAKLVATAPDPSDAGSSPAIAPTLPPELDPLSEAIASRRVATFGYRTSAGVESVRTIDPWTLVWRRGHAYVIGRDHDRDAQRAFRLDRITGQVRLEGEPGAFAPPAELDAAAATDRPGPPPVTARFEVAPSHRWLVEREGGVEVAVTDDHVVHELVAPRQAVVQLACELGDRGRVTAPPEVVDGVIAALTALRDMHAGDPG